MERVTNIATTLFALGAILGTAATAYAAIDDPVRLDKGLISGVASGAAASTPDVRVFKGVPFAAPPTARLLSTGTAVSMAFPATGQLATRPARSC